MSILLRNATILVPSGTPNGYVVPLREHSLLIEGSKISQIAPHVEPPENTEIIDCSGKIVSPGFVDTHHHVWQTQLKGRHADQALVEYYPNGNAQHANYTAEDIFWGQLGGCLEALDAGTTTVVDHAHMSESPAHTSNAVEATIASGIRSVFCYTPTERTKTWHPEMSVDGSLLDDWVIDHLKKLAALAPFGDGRVELGLGFDGFMLPKEQVVPFFQQARALGTKVITSHYVRKYFGDESLVDKLDSYDLLGPDILLSHASNLTESDIRKLNKARAWISTTPSTELQMGHGDIVCFREGCDMVSQMRLALQHERATRNEQLIAQGKSTRSLNIFVQDVFRLATIQGARAIHAEDRLGSLEVGKRADIVVFDGTSPGMICAAEQDPVAAVVLHSSVRDIETVIVDGHVRKSNSKVVPVYVRPSLEESSISEQRLEWNQVARELVASRKRIEDAAAESGSNFNDREPLVEAFMNMAHMEKAKFVKL
ncbi:hypothetical protein N7470_003475 [Penicillium chermesinum]|nr:hypothetical protein N7470_003475 [Penicillium chermesinum]